MLSPEDNSKTRVVDATEIEDGAGQEMRGLDDVAWDTAFLGPWKQRVANDLKLSRHRDK